jgi:serine/threonine protein kinase
MDPMMLDLKLATLPETYLNRSIWARKNDRSVKSLFADHCTSQHSADQIEIMLLRYRPCMSCTLKITSAINGKSSSNIISKVYSDKQVIHRVSCVMKQLYYEQKNAGVSYFACPITTIPKKNVLIQDFVSGKSLEILIANTLTGEKPRLVDAKSIFEKCGNAIRFVHGCKIKVSKQRSLLTEWSELNQKVRDILDINQIIGIKLHALSTLLKETYTFGDAPQKAVLTHGDFKPGQILVDSLGVRLLDFDNVALSEPEFDIGTFIATLKQSYLVSIRGTNLLK